MAWILSILLAFIVFGILSYIGERYRDSRHERDSRREEEVKVGRALKFAAKAIIAVWAIGHTALETVQSIPAGHIGVVYEFGAIKSQVEEGIQFVAPWRDVRLANVQVERHPFDKLTCFSQETQDVFVDATLNTRVSPRAIQELYRSVGPKYFDVVVRPRLEQNFKDEVVKYKSVDIAPNREKIREAVRKRLDHELEAYSIAVVDLLLDDIDFTPEFKAAIGAKQVATQRSLEEEQKVAVERHRAEQAIEKAKGEGQSILVVAEKQAEANRKLAESLTPTLVQYAMIQKLAGNINVAILPAGQSFILDPSFLKGGDGK